MRTAKSRNNSPTAGTPRSSSTDESLGAFEQFGRIDILEGGLAGSPFVNVSTLANLAQQQLDSGRSNNAAALLRAAEHLSFAALAPRNSARLTAHIPAELRVAVNTEIDRLTQTTQDLWNKSAKTANRSVIDEIYTTALEDARQAFRQGAYRSALHLARAAEALAHVAEGLPATLPADRELTHRLAS